MFNNKGFTLIELLVVVLIIGILAAIAVPQYQLAVAKSEYATLKAQARAIAEAINRYNLATGTYPTSVNDLDISRTGNCWFLDPQNGPHAMCFSRGKQEMGFYFNYITLKPSLCYTKPNYELGNKICQQETGDRKPNITTKYKTYDYY